MYIVVVGDILSVEEIVALDASTNVMIAVGAELVITDLHAGVDDTKDILSLVSIVIDAEYDVLVSIILREDDSTSIVCMLSITRSVIDAGTPERSIRTALDAVLLKAERYVLSSINVGIIAGKSVSCDDSADGAPSVIEKVSMSATALEI